MQFMFQRVRPCLWFDSESGQVADFHSSTFPDSRIVAITHSTRESTGSSDKPAGSVLTVVFELDGQPFIAPSPRVAMTGPRHAGG